MAERRQELRFFRPLNAFLSIRNFTQRPRSADLSSLLPADRELTSRSSTPEASGTAGKGSPASRFFISPDLIVLPRIYIALYVNYPIQSHHFYLNCIERGLIPPA